MSLPTAAIGRLNGTAQNVAYTASKGTITNGISAGVNKIRVLVTTAAFVMIDDGSGTPSGTLGAYVPALSPEYFVCTPGQKVSAVQVSAGGSLYVSEVS
jgi:hypothetical protein